MPRSLELRKDDSVHQPAVEGSSFVKRRLTDEEVLERNRKLAIQTAKRIEAAWNLENAPVSYRTLMMRWGGVKKYARE